MPRDPGSRKGFRPRIIAVAAGGTPVEQLAGADHVLADLTDTEKLKRVIGELVRSDI